MLASDFQKSAREGCERFVRLITGTDGRIDEGRVGKKWGGRTRDRERQRPVYETRRGTRVVSTQFTDTKIRFVMPGARENEQRRERDGWTSRCVASRSFAYFSCCFLSPRLPLPFAYAVARGFFALRLASCLPSFFFQLALTLSLADPSCTPTRNPMLQNN